MKPITSVADLIKQLGGYDSFSSSLGLRSSANARVMKQRGRIPMRYWDDVVVAASRKDIPGVTHAFLKRLHAPETNRAEAA